MFPEKIDGSINSCKSHLDTLDKSDTTTVELEALLVSSLILLIVSEYEIAIEEMFTERAIRCGDGHIAQYVRSTIARKFRSPDLGKITDVLGQFGVDYKKSFSDAVINTEQHAAWDNIMTARHAIVHKNGTLNITLGELILTYPKTKVILDALKATLDLPEFKVIVPAFKAFLEKRSLKCTVFDVLILAPNSSAFVYLAISSG